ncbi:MAG TPA: HPF/RaiA family ribosome-associated protein [Flavisolibacter sp.]|jgi:putative sigma-54 modulation protein|nr:HPF/RaiA family ribosome-associated protein [Flavisolibacter sp.]
MDIIIQSLGFKASLGLESFIQERLGKLNPNDSIIRANVTLFKASDNVQQNNYCEIRLEVPGNDHFVKKSSEQFEHSVAEAVDTLQKMLHKAKDKQASRKHSNNVAIEDGFQES